MGGREIISKRPHDRSSRVLFFGSFFPNFRGYPIVYPFHYYMPRRIDQNYTIFSSYGKPLAISLFFPFPPSASPKHKTGHAGGHLRVTISPSRFPENPHS